MFSNKMRKAVNDFGLLEILTGFREVMGIDSRLDRSEEEKVAVTFILGYKEQEMILDDIIFDESLDVIDKTDMILEELIYYFDLAEDPIVEFADALSKEFYIHEKRDHEEVYVDIIEEDTVEVVVVNNVTGEKIEYTGFIEKDITYENASRVGYEVAHKMMADYWGIYNYWD